MSGIHFEITGGNDSFKRSIEESRTIAKRFIDEVEKGSKGIDELFRKGTEGQRLSVQMTKEAIAAEKLKQETSKASILNTKAQIEAMKLELEQIKLLKQQGNSNTDRIVHVTQEITNVTNEATKVFVKYAGSLDELDRRVKDLTKEYLSMNAAQKASTQGQSVINEIAILNSQRKIEADSLRALQKEYVNTQKIQDLQEGSIVALRAELSKLTASYDGLGRSMRNGATGKELLGSIRNVTQELNEAEQASMRFNRNVGNYASGWNGLNVQVQQVARELPSLAIGANTFFLAISNNLPMLADELKRAKTEYKAFVAEGKSATPVWKQVLSSLFSWQTALVAGITILSVYGKEIISWVGSLFTAKKALSETYQSLEDYQNKVGETSGSVIATLEKLSEGWKRLGGDIDAQKKYILDNKDAINSMGVSVTDAAEAERIFNSNKETFILGILQRAKAAATMELAAEEYKKSVQKMLEADSEQGKGSNWLDKVKSVLINIPLSILPGSKKTNEKDLFEWRIKSIQKEGETYKQSMLDLIYKAMGIDEEGRKEIEKAGGKLTESLVEGSVGAIEAAIALKQQALSKVTNREDYKRIEAEIKLDKAKLDAITGGKTKKSKYINSHQQTEAIKKATQEIKDTLTESEMSIRQQQIDLNEEGSKKQLAQIRLDYDKRYQEIQKKERDLLQKLQNEERKQWEKDNPKFKEKNLQFVPKITSLTPEQRTQYDKEYSLAYQKQEKDTKSLLDKLLEKYRDYDAQRTAIEKQGNEEIAYLQTQRTDANAQEIDRAIEVAKEKIKEGVQSVNDAQAGAMTKDNSFLKNLFGDTSQMAFKDLQNLIEQAKQVQAYLSGNGDSKGITFISPEQLKAIEKSPAELDKLNKATDNLLKGKKGNEWDDIFDGFTKGLAKLKSAKGFKEVSQGMQDIGESASKASSIIGDVAGNLSSMFEEMGNTGAADAMSGVQDAMNAISNIGQGFAKGGIIGGIAAAVGEAANFIGKAFAASARHQAALKEIMNETIAQQRAYNLLLLEQNLLYEKGTTIFGIDAYGKAANAIKVMKQAIADLNKELSGTAEQKKSQVGTGFVQKLFGSIKGANTALKQAYAGLADIEIKTGHEKTGLFGWGKGKDIYSSILSVDEYKNLIDANGKLNIGMAETIINTKTMSDEDKSAFQHMIDLAKQAEEALKAVSDYLTDIFGDLGNTMSDALVDAFSNGTDAAQAFTDSVSNMLETLAKQMIYSVTLAPVIEKAQTQMMDVMKDTGLSNEDKFKQFTGVLDNLVGEAIDQQDYANRLYGEFQQMAKDKGFDILGSDSSDRETSKKGFASMSQDSADELNGRFTVIQGHTYEINGSVKAIQSDTAKMAEKLSYLTNMDKNISDMVRGNDMIVSHLSNIERYTENLVDIRQFMYSMKLGIDTLNTKGLTLKR